MACVVWHALDAINEVLLPLAERRIVADINLLTQGYLGEWNAEHWRNEWYARPMNTHTFHESVQLRMNDVARGARSTSVLASCQPHVSSCFNAESAIMRTAQTDT